MNELSRKRLAVANIIMQEIGSSTQFNELKHLGVRKINICIKNSCPCVIFYLGKNRIKYSIVKVHGEYKISRTPKKGPEIVRNVGQLSEISEVLLIMHFMLEE